MSETEKWSFPPEHQPDPRKAGFDVDRALASVVALEATIPDDAMTAQTLGTERTGSAVVIGEDGLALTIGYLVTEAEQVRLTTQDGRTIDAHPIAVDFASGFALVAPLGKLDVPAIARARAADVAAGDSVTVVSHGGREHALAARVVAKQEFAGYWEYAIDDAFFTAPLHPAWSGAALLDAKGRLVGIGSLFVQQVVDGDTSRGNMFVPVDLVEPVLSDLTTQGRRSGPPRPWIGVYLNDEEGKLVVQAVAPGGPCDQAGIAPGDQVAAIADVPVVQLAQAWRVLWRRGAAGVEVPLTVVRDGNARRVRVTSIDRETMLRKPRLQ